MTTYATITLLLSAAILYFVIRYRVHIHISYTPPEPRRRSARRPAGREPLAFVTSPASDPVLIADLTAALVGLGTAKTKARTAARLAAAEPGTLSFEDRLRIAIKEAA